MKEIEISRAGEGIAFLTLNRPAKRNAVSLAMWQAIPELIAELEADETVRVLIVTGAGGHFCAGADISEFAEIRADAAAATRYEEAVVAAEMALAGFSRPTIAAINGVAVGGGCGLAVCCDFRVGDRTARMGITAARLGIVYTTTETSLLVRTVGPVAAKRILFTGAIFDAAEAASIGLLDRLVEEDAIKAALELAQAMAGNAPLSLSGSKFIINAIAEGTDRDRANEIRRVIDGAADSEDYREGVTAFAEKRPPKFQGK